MSKFFKAAAALSTILIAASIWSYAVAWMSGAISLSDIMLGADKAVLNTTILTMLVMIAFQRLELVWLPILLAGGEAIYASQILISGLHSMLLQIDAYRDLLGRHATRQVNPQYAMVIAYVTCFLVLFALCLRRASRSFDRTVTLVMAASIMATFTLFHTFLMIGISRGAATEGRAIHAALVSDAEDFAPLCRTLSLECTHHGFEDARSGELASLDPLAAHTLADLAAHGTRLEIPFVWDGATDDDASRTTFFIIGIGSDGAGYRVARSRESFEAATRFEELRYTTQALAAHATWMLMAFGLIAIHRRHARPKVRRAFSDDSFR